MREREERIVFRYWRERERERVKNSMGLTPYLSEEDAKEEIKIDKENFVGANSMCSVCEQEFHWFSRWKHHCRVCALPVCSSCSNFLQDPRVHKTAYRRCSTCGEEKHSSPSRLRRRRVNPNTSPDRKNIDTQQNSLSYPLSVETIKYAGKAIEILPIGERVVSMIVVTTKAVYVLDHRSLGRKHRVPFKSILKLVQSTDDYSIGIKIQNKQRLVLSSLESGHILHEILSSPKGAKKSVVYVKHLRHMRRFLFHGDTTVLISRKTGRSYPRHVRLHTV